MSCLHVAVNENSPDMSSYPTVQHPEIEELDYVRDLYARADRLTAEARANLAHHLNVPYGSHIKQRVDIYLPDRDPRDCPILVFLHGGGWAEGHRAHGGYMAIPYAARGIVTVVAGYRLLTDGARYPEPANDVRQLLVWLNEHAAPRFGNPAAIFLSGHASGATLAADVAVDRSWLRSLGVDPESLRGFAGASGNYNLPESCRTDPAEAQMYMAYAPTPSLLDQASAILHVMDPPPAAVIAHGNADISERRTAQSSRALFETLRGKDVDARLLELDGENHIDTAFSLASPGTVVFEAVAAMVEA
jgi:acetyl esterase/lipase